MSMLLDRCLFLEMDDEFNRHSNFFKYLVRGIVDVSGFEITFKTLLSHVLPWLIIEGDADSEMVCVKFQPSAVATRVMPDGPGGVSQRS